MFSSRNSKPAMPSIVAANLEIKGNLDSDGDVQVEGAVEGDIKTKRLTVGEGGRVRGAVEAESVTVAGALTGTIRAKTVTIQRTARVIADIVQEQLSIEAGAVFEGSSRLLDKDEPGRKPEPATGSSPPRLKVAGSDPAA